MSEMEKQVKGPYLKKFQAKMLDLLERLSQERMKLK
jgi:hypothetical protein